MNTIPAWVFIAIAIVGLIMSMAGSKKKKKKNGTALLGFLLCAVGVVLFLCSYFKVFNPDAKDVEKAGWNAEAYGVAQLILKDYPNKPVVVLGYLKEELAEEYVQTMSECGISNVKYI